MNRCKDCRFRDEDGICNNPKITDTQRWHVDYDEDENEHKEKIKDMLLYSYDEGGSFFVGEEFGCVHWCKKLD